SCYTRASHSLSSLRLFCFSDTATTEIYTLSLHDALPIWEPSEKELADARVREHYTEFIERQTLFADLEAAEAELATNKARYEAADRKSTRLNSSHVKISYAVFCLKKKNNHYKTKENST